MRIDSPVSRISWLSWLIGKYSPRLLSGQSLIGSGWSLLLAAVPGVALTMAIYYFVNTQLLIPRIATVYETVRLPAFDDVTSDAAAADRAIELKWAASGLRPWLKDVMHAPTADYPAMSQALGLFRIPGQRDVPPEYRTELRRQLTGRMKPDPRVPAFLEGFYECFPISVETSSGGEALQALARLEDKRSLRAIEAENQSQAEEKKRFVARYLEAFETEIRGSVRELRRYNGWVQWLTLSVALVTLVIIARRWLLITKLRCSAWSAETAVRSGRAIPPENVWPIGSEVHQIVKHAATAQQQGAPFDAVTDLEHVRAAVNSGTYGLFANLVSTLPALGFVGTILGMGEALTKADGLFASQDKQVVIGQITRGLGYAFDATLVSLGTAIVVSLLLSLLRVVEQRMFREWSGVLALTTTSEKVPQRRHARMSEV
jgi:biopolymer transport protein ExbB/TolQ